LRKVINENIIEKNKLNIDKLNIYERFSWEVLNKK
jgi:hypothetical protein